MEEDEIKTKEDVHHALSLIRDRDDCPDNIVDLIDVVRYADFFDN